MKEELRAVAKLIYCLSANFFLTGGEVVDGAHDLDDVGVTAFRLHGRNASKHDAKAGSAQQPRRDAQSQLGILA